MRSVGAYLDGSRLRGLSKLVREQQALLCAIRNALPESVAHHCLGALREGDRLTLFTDSATWATRLRFLGSELPGNLGGLGRALREVRVRVLPLALRAQPPSRPLEPLSPATARTLMETAASLTDGRLQEALRRLALRTGSPQGDSTP